VVIDGFVLAGGRSRRMGADKARVAWNGQPLALVVADHLRSVCTRVALVRRGAPDGLPWPGPDGRDVEVVSEPEDGVPHPLWGVAAALAAARTPLVLLAPCDVPWLTRSSLERLVEAAPSVAVAGGRLHPLVAVVGASSAERAHAFAREGRSARDFAAELTPVEIPTEELRNVNDPTAVPRPGPVERLLARVPWTTPAERARLVAGEIARLAAHGMVDPHFSG
jgi:molybdopterin-guanine dinucleotide biosynthesis protein A